MIEIDGSKGEGGGQILRTSLALAMVTSQPVRFVKIRAARSKPGLLRQHLTAVKAAAAVSGAEIDGAEIGSSTLTFSPAAIRSGDFHFAVGSAGSCTLVFQTILPALMIADGPSTVTLEGGTHNPFAPPFEFLQRAFLPLLERCGPKVELTLERPGFYPAGGGKFNATVSPSKLLKSFNVIERGKQIDREALAIVSRLPANIAARELKLVARKLGWAQKCLKVDEVTSSPGPGNVLLLTSRHEHVTEVVSGFGEKDMPAERVAQRAVRELQQYIKCAAPVGIHLADQLLIPLALAGGGSFRTTHLTQHTLTNIETIKMFMDVKIETEERPDKSRIVRIG